MPKRKQRTNEREKMAAAAAAKRTARERETPEEREVRLARRREYDRVCRENESQEVREARLLRQRLFIARKKQTLKNRLQRIALSKIKREEDIKIEDQDTPLHQEFIWSSVLVLLGSNKQAETESRTSSEEREDMPRTAELLPEAGSSYGPLFEAVEALKEISNQNKESNQFHAFANHVAVQLEQLPLERALELQSEIQNIITAKRVQVLKELGHRADVVMAEEVDLKPLILPDI